MTGKVINKKGVNSHGKLNFPWIICCPMGYFKIPWEYDNLPWDFLNSHGTFMFPWENFYIPNGLRIFPWENTYPMGMQNFPWDFEISYGKTNNPTGKHSMGIYTFVI